MTTENTEQAAEGAIRTSRERSIPSLDGLRAVSIGLVVLSHNATLFVGQSEAGQYLAKLAELGVDMFFVISGFLITFLLLKEKNETGTVSLRAFYFRRAMRIFPVFYLFLAVDAVVAPLNWKMVTIAGLYLWNYLPNAAEVSLTHLWSLSVEEQFYLVWPLLQKALRSRAAVKVAVGLIVAEPVVRLVSFVLWPSLRGSGKIATMFHTRADTMMFGCLVALLWHDERFKAAAKKYVRGFAFAAALLLVFVAGPLLDLHVRAYHAVAYTVEGFALVVVLVFVVRRPESAAGRVLNWSPMRGLGRMSYSLYLWQQMFLVMGRRWFPVTLIAAFACAWLSYRLVEMPGLRLRDRMLAWWRGRSVVATA